MPATMRNRYAGRSSAASTSRFLTQRAVVRELHSTFARLKDRSFAPDAPDLAQGVAHLAHRHVRPGGVDDRRHQVPVLVRGVLLEPAERGLDCRRVAAPAQGAHALDLLALEGGVDAQELDRPLLLELVAVDAYDDALLRLDLRLVAERRLRDLALEEVLLDRCYDAAETLDPREVVVGLALELARQVLDEVGAAERIDRVYDSRLMCDHLLRAQRKPHRVLGRQRERLVERVRVQRLRAAEHGRQRLERSAHDVDLRLLRGQRHAGGLRVEAHQPRARVLRSVFLPQLASPDAPRGSVFRDLLEEVEMRVEEEGETRREVIDVETALDRPVDVCEAVRERERELLRRGRAGLADVVARDRDRMPLGHLLRAELDHVRDQPHRRLGREDELLLRDVLLEDVRLDRPAKLRAGNALLLADADVEREQHRRR